MIWNLYRGTQDSPVLLQSIYMALEEWLLNFCAKENLEKLCLYLLEHSKSASITAIVTSVTLANPEKLFNVAIILFKIKEARPNGRSNSG